MDDPSSKSLRDRLDALLRRAREISAEIERRVDEVTSEPARGPEVASGAPPAVTAEAAAVTAEALTIASESAGAAAAPPIPEAPLNAPTTVIPEAAIAVAADAADAARTEERVAKDPATPDDSGD